MSRGWVDENLRSLDLASFSFYSPFFPGESYLGFGFCFGCLRCTAGKTARGYEIFVGIVWPRQPVLFSDLRSHRLIRRFHFECLLKVFGLCFALALSLASISSRVGTV